MSDTSEIDDGDLSEIPENIEIDTGLSGISG
jgi:hypothetical protein